MRQLAAHDRDGDGFIDWREAREYLDGTVPDLFEGFQSMARGNWPLQIASQADLQLLKAQVSQDPQVFGTLAWRSDRRPPAAEQAPAARGPRFGVAFAERYERGGAYLEVTSVDPRSPGARVSVWKNGKRDMKTSTLIKGDTITMANKARVRSLADLARILDGIPAGGELNVVGYDASSGGADKYEATVTLDRAE